MRERVLVLDARAISALATARRLDQNGLEVHCGEEFSHTITGYSRSTAASHTYPSPDKYPGAFQDSLGSLIEKFEFDFVVPARDSTTRLLAEMANSLPETTQTLLDSPEQIERLQDKRQFAKLASKHRIPIPDTYLPEEQGIEYVQQHADFPVVVKPTNESGARGIRRVEHPGDLPDTYRAARASDGDVIVQEVVDHSGGHFSIGTVFDRDGVPRAIHAYEELIQYPDSGGPAIRARSIAIEPWVHEMLGFLEELSWTGPAHMDVLFDPDDGTYKLLEVNPRLWSSIALTIDSGVDIPGVMLDIAAGTDPEVGESYETGRIYRWVLPNEILWAADGWNTPARIGRLLKCDGDETTYSILSRDDPGAILGTALQSARFLLDPKKRAQMFGRGWQAETDAPRRDQVPASRHE